MITKEWGFLRETREEAKGTDPDTGLCRTCLEDYLEIIFPEIMDWVHNKAIPNLYDKDGKRILFRPDFRSEALKTIIEFDGLPHYTNPENIVKDAKNQALYEGLGYRVIRIPYFIQLSNDVVDRLFGRHIAEPLFDPSIPSIGPLGRNTPAYLCPGGIRRMTKEFARYPQQYRVNLNYLKEKDPENFTEWRLLEELVSRYCQL